MANTRNNFFAVIDGSALLSRIYYGTLPTSIRYEGDESKREKLYGQLLHTSKGQYTNGVLGFFRTIFNILRDQKPQYMVITWDVGRNTFRREIDPEYKGTRAPVPAPLKDQFIYCQDLCEKMGFVQLSDEQFEADDFCGTLAKKFEKEIPVRILTKDKDYFQLISDNTHIWMMENSKNDVMELFSRFSLDESNFNLPDKVFKFDNPMLKSVYGYSADEVVMIKALAGDPADNIKGVPGIGMDTAIKLSNEYHSLEALYAAITGLNKTQMKELTEHFKAIGIKRSPVNALLKEDDNSLVGRKAAEQSFKLATIKTDINLDDYFLFGATLEDFRITVNPETAKQVLATFEITSINTSY